MRQAITAVGVLITLVAPEARGDLQSFSNFCLVGAIRTCASIQLQTTAILNGGGHRIGTAVVLRIRNLEGLNLADNTGGSVITRAGITQPNLGSVSNLVVTSSSGVGLAGTPQDNWVANNKPIGGQVEFSAGLFNVGSHQAQLNGGIVGCHNPAGFASMNEYFRTCNSGGWVVFSFNTTGTWSADQAEVAWMIQSAAVNGQSYECRTAALTGEHACLPSSIPEPPTVVPEPSTLALLGTGLLGVWFSAGGRRRRGLTWSLGSGSRPVR